MLTYMLNECDVVFFQNVLRAGMEPIVYRNVVSVKMICVTLKMVNVKRAVRQVSLEMYARNVCKTFC